MKYTKKYFTGTDFEIRLGVYSQSEISFSFNFDYKDKKLGTDTLNLNNPCEHGNVVLVILENNTHTTLFGLIYNANINAFESWKPESRVEVSGRFDDLSVYYNGANIRYNSSPLGFWNLLINAGYAPNIYSAPQYNSCCNNMTYSNEIQSNNSKAMAHCTNSAHLLVLEEVLDDIRRTINDMMRGYEQVGGKKIQGYTDAYIKLKELRNKISYMIDVNKFRL